MLFSLVYLFQRALAHLYYWRTHNTTGWFVHCDSYVIICIDAFCDFTMYLCILTTQMSEKKQIFTSWF